MRLRIKKNKYKEKLLNHSIYKEIKEWFKYFPREVWLIGGITRNILLNRERDLYIKNSNFDIDICSAALPEVVLKWANLNNYKAAIINESHLVVSIIIKGIRIEHTTFRKEIKCDGKYATIIPANSIRKDIKRRDFTINSIGISTKGRFIFPKYALKDIENKTLRFIGNPTKRIKESKIRYLRAFRFKTEYKLNFEVKTEYALKDISSEHLRNLPSDAFIKELRKINYNKSFVKDLIEFNFFEKLIEVSHFDKDLFESLLEEPTLVNLFNYLNISNTYAYINNYFYFHRYDIKLNTYSYQDFIKRLNLNLNTFKSWFNLSNKEIDIVSDYEKARELKYIKNYFPEEWILFKPKVINKKELAGHFKISNQLLELEKLIPAKKDCLPYIKNMSEVNETYKKTIKLYISFYKNLIK